MGVPGQTQRTRESFFPLMGRHLARLYHFVRHQLAYLEAVGDLPRGELTLEEIVDAVVVRASREYRTRRAGARSDDG
jgi:hypothetical protein